MKHTARNWIVGTVLLTIAGTGGYLLGRPSRDYHAAGASPPPTPVSVPGSEGATADSAPGGLPGPAAGTSATGGVGTAGKVLYWYDPMNPEQHFDHPGRSPFMDMPLVPRYAEEGGAAGVHIDPLVSQNLGLRLTPVRREPLRETLNAAASVQYNERDLALVQARTGGFVQRTFRHAAGDVVAAGAPLAELLVPEWSGAQEEYLAVLRTGDAALAAAGRRRLELLGMPPDLVERVVRSGHAEASYTLAAPLGGVIEELAVRPGMTLAAGAAIARINGIDSVWVEAALPEAQAAQVRVGQSARTTLAAWPGTVRSGRVVAVLPQVDPASRSLRVRVELANPGGRLKPGMFAQVEIDQGNAQPVLSVPSEALIRTGSRTLVLRAGGNGHYQAVQVQTGSEGGGRTAILAGLAEGEQVVASGQFLVDSEASLQGLAAVPLAPVAAAARDPRAATPATATPAAGTAEGRGRVERLADDHITLAHEAIPALGWAAMTMSFRLATPALAADLKPGDPVRFTLKRRDQRWIVERISRAPEATP